jgi:hypothetical protein
MKQETKRALYNSLWIYFIVVQILFIVWIVSINSGKSNCDDIYRYSKVDRDICEVSNAASTGVGMGLVIFLWVVVDLIFVGFWLWKDPNQRDCPKCRSRGKLQNGIIKCRICGHEWQNPPS